MTRPDQPGAVTPVRLCVLTPDVLGDAYPHQCGTIHLQPCTEGYGMVMGYRDERPVTLVTATPDVIIAVAQLSAEARAGLALPDGTFPLMHPSWIDLPAACTVATIEPDGTVTRGPAYPTDTEELPG